MKTTRIRIIATQVLITLIILSHGVIKISLSEIGSEKIECKQNTVIAYQTKTFECISIKERQTENYDGKVQTHYESVLCDVETNDEITVDSKLEIGKVYNKHCATIKIPMKSNKYDSRKTYIKESELGGSLEEFKVDVRKFIDTEVSQTEYITILIIVLIIIIIVIPLSCLCVYVIIKPQNFL